MDDNNGALKYGLVALVVVGAIILGFGLLFKTADATQKAEAGFVSEQRQMMRDAMSMAREAREMQKQHMDLMRQAMEESYENYETGEYSGNETYSDGESSGYTDGY